MNNAEHLAELLESLKKTTGIISTLAEKGGIDSAVVYFTVDKNLNLYFFTRANSAKSKNIMQNSLISFVTYSEELMQTFQLRGDASAIEDPSEQAVAFEALLKIANKQSNGNPPIAQMMQSEITVFKVIPLWARFSNFGVSNDSNKIEELKVAEFLGEQL
ncbi:MAG: pyridoxamine 5'-phosphate oxidase family protein [Patescibacteria group bacterium]